MEKGLLFFTISAACLWLLLDEFFGTKRLSNVAQNFVPNIKSPGEAVSEFVEGTATKEEMQSKEKEVTDSVDKNKNLPEKAKKAIKDAIKKFYDDAEFNKNGKFTDEA